MKPLDYTPAQKKRASTKMALGLSEFEASTLLLKEELYREALVHMYFTSFYVSQALLAKWLKANPTHKAINTEIHRRYGRGRLGFPRRYVTLHSTLWNLRNQFSYRTPHVPSPSMLQGKHRVLAAYLKFALKVVPRVEILDVLRAVYEEHQDRIYDFSYDIYCPKTYAHHARLTFWQPPFYLEIFSPDRLARGARELLGKLKVNRASDYVVGINSRLNQYSPIHLLMLDIDSVDPEVETLLASIGGVVLKSGRGFHFISHDIIDSQKAWVAMMTRLKRDKVMRKYLDRDHLEISLQRGYSTLRVTESPIKPHIPFFYKEL